MAGCCHFSLNLKSCFCKIQRISNWNTESKEMYQKMSRFGSLEKEHFNKINVLKSITLLNSGSTGRQQSLINENSFLALWGMSISLKIPCHIVIQPRKSQYEL